MAVIFRDKFWPKFQQEFSQKFQQEFLPKFQNFGINLNKIFYKILANLNILPIIFAEVLLSLLQYYSKNPVRNHVSISAILLLKYCYTFSYRQRLINLKNAGNISQEVCKSGKQTSAHAQVCLQDLQDSREIFLVFLAKGRLVYILHL